MNNNHKIVLLGDSTVGKTSFALRIKEDKFYEKSESTIGCEFFSKKYNVPGKNDTIKLLIWDTSGQEVFKHFTPQFTRNTSLALVFFDLSQNFNEVSLLQYIKEWIKFVQEDTTVLVVPTKYDLTKKDTSIDLFNVVKDIKNEIHVANSISSKENIGIESLEDQIIRILENKKIIQINSSINFEEISEKKCCNI